MIGKDELLHLIAQDRLEQVFDYFSGDHAARLSKQSRKDLTNLSGRYVNAKRSFNNNIIKNEDYQLELSKIRLTLIDLVNDIEKGKPDYEDGSVRKRKKLIWTIGGVAILVLMIGGFYGGYFDEMWPAKTTPETQQDTIVPLDTNNPKIKPILSEEEKINSPESPKENLSEIENPTSEDNRLPQSNLANRAIEKDKNQSNTDEPLIEQQEVNETQSSLEETKISEIDKPKLPLKLTLKTNKGLDDIKVSSSELLRLYTQVNQPCFLRVIYRLADDQLILLDDGRWIDEKSTGKFVEIGDGFIPDNPFGKETMYIFAQSVKFTSLKTRVEDGYEIILEGLPASLEKSKDKGLRKNVKQVEAQLEILTVE